MTSDSVTPEKMVLGNSIFWLLANAIGIIIYLSVESWILVPQSEEDALNGIAEINYWMTLDFPVLIVYLVLNIIWLMRIVRGDLSSKKARWRIWLLVCLSWIIALVYRGFVIKLIYILIMMIDGQAWK